MAPPASVCLVQLVLHGGPPPRLSLLECYLLCRTRIAMRAGTPPAAARSTRGERLPHVATRCVGSRYHHTALRHASLGHDAHPLEPWEGGVLTGFAVLATSSSCVLPWLPQPAQWQCFTPGLLVRCTLLEVHCERNAACSRMKEPLGHSCSFTCLFCHALTSSTCLRPVQCSRHVARPRQPTALGGVMPSTMEQ